MDTEQVLQLSQKVGQDLYRLKTLTILYPSEDIDIDQWLVFLSADMLSLFKQFLAKVLVLLRLMLLLASVF